MKTLLLKVTYTDPQDRLRGEQDVANALDAFGVPSLVEAVKTDQPSATGGAAHAPWVRSEAARLLEKPGHWECQVRSQLNDLVAIACGQTKEEAEENASRVVRSYNRDASLVVALTGAQGALRKALPLLPPDGEAVHVGEWLDEIAVLLEAEKQLR